MTEAPAGAAILEMEDVTVRFGGFTALDRVSMSLAPGTVLGLVGPNGAGKTTLIRVVSTLLVPSAGRARVAGKDVVRQAQAVRRLIGFLPDFSGIYQDMRVEEFLIFFADAHGLPRARRLEFLDKALDLSGLGPRAQDFVEDLSRGMRAKLSFVRVLAGDPRLVILDEPFANLDPVARSEMLEFMGVMRREGRALVVSSHQLSDLEKVADRVLFLDRGRVVTEGQGTGIAVYLLVTGEPLDGMEAMLSAVDGISSVTPGHGPGRFLVGIAPDRRPSSVLAGIAAAGICVEEWRRDAPSLEERLVRIVRGGAS